MGSQRYKFGNVKPNDILKFTKEELSGGKSLVGYTIDSIDGAITAFKNENPLGIGISSISSNGTIKVISSVLDLSSLTVGSTFTLGKYQVESETPWPIEWEIVHQTNDYQIAMTKQIIDMRCFDAKEPNNPDSNIKSDGNNNWQYSNIEQFLNSDQSNWYSAQHQYDAPPNKDNCWYYENGTTYNAYDTHKGFLYYFSDEEKNLLKDITFDLYSYDIKSSYTWTGKVWLPTYTQMSGKLNNKISEGTKFDKYSDDNSRIKTLHPNCTANNEYCKINNITEGTARVYWMSSGVFSNSCSSYYVNLHGNPEFSITPYRGLIGLAPCICLPKTGEFWS